MPETAENVAEDPISLVKTRMLLPSARKQRPGAQASGRFAQEITLVTIAQRKADPVVVAQD